MSLVLDTLQLQQELALLLARMEDPIPFFDYVGHSEVAITKQRIMHSKEDPDGKSWIPWTNYTREKREHQGNAIQGLLWDTGDLLSSIKFDVDGTFGVDIGTDIWYAPKHQVGEGKVPQRQFLGWEPARLPYYESAFLNYLERGVP